MSVASKCFGLAGGALVGAILTGVYLMIRIASLDAEVLVEQSYEQYRIARQAVEGHRAFFRNIFWLLPALASLLSVFGWVAYFEADSQERSPAQGAGGILVTVLSALLLLAVGLTFIRAGAH